MQRVPHFTLSAFICVICVICVICGQNSPAARPNILLSRLRRALRHRSAAPWLRGFVSRFAATAVLFIAFVPHGILNAKSPNIIFLFTDDHATQAISSYHGTASGAERDARGGSTLIQTPGFDRIAAEGMRFDRCLVTNSICGPSRAVIQTGKYSHLNGFLRNGNTFDGSQQTAPKLLRKAGYQTAIVGKWHLKSLPTGFDHFEVLKGQGQYYNPMLITNGENVNHVGYTTDLITDRSIEWLENRDQSKPFFLMSQHKAPHGRWEPALRHLELFDDVTFPEPPTLFDDYSGRSPAAAGHAMGIATEMNEHRLMLKYSSRHTPEQLAVFDAYFRPRNEAFLKANLTGKEKTRWHFQRYIKNYLRCVTAVDENITRILDYLDENDLAENTVVIYSSDQGFYLGEHGWFDKRWMYEESLRAPLLARWPGVIEPGSTNNDIVSNLDFAQTFLDIAGAPDPADMQGASLVPLLKGNTPPDWRESFYYHYYESGGHGVPAHDGVATAGHKLLRFYEPELDTWELFDRQKDPQELQSEYTNPEYAPLVKKLTAELLRLREKYGVQDPG